MSSIVFSDEESQYLKAVLTWRDKAEDDRSTQPRGAEPQKQPVGEFRILVLGDKGVGKTSILTRFCTGTFSSEPAPGGTPYERGCRHPVEIESQTYMVDALELPSQHLSSKPMLQQAIGITEAAVLVYDTRRPDSLRLCQNMRELIREAVGPREYGLLLLGHKSEPQIGANDGGELRLVSASEGSRAAGGFGLRCAFMEASARTGENISAIFPLVGREILKIRWINQQRREQAERVALLKLQAGGPTSSSAPGSPLKRRFGLWRTIKTPFLRRGSAVR